MKRALAALVLMAGTLAIAQQPATPVPAATDVPTLQYQLAQAQVKIAQLTAERDELRFQLGLYEVATGATQRRQAAQQAIDAAIAAADAAKPKTQPAKK